MRALTVRQPWAWAIVHGGKDVENRSRNVAGGYRGPVAIHAATRYVDALGDAIDTIGRITGEWIPPWDTGHPCEVFGAFVGVVDLVSVHHDNLTPDDHASPWAQRDHWHLVLVNPRPLPKPIPARGMLGLWTPPAEILEQLQAVTR